jgi:endogenous inhibitor of DNA gyrase (YacG/DUF329 family)
MTRQGNRSVIDTRCPICEKVMQGDPRDFPNFPFCSQRCKTIDLGRWLGGRYGIPAEEPDEDFEFPEDGGS